MALADMQRRQVAPPRVAWHVEKSRLRCVVGWQGERPPLAEVLPLLENLGLVLIDHRPEESAESFEFFRVENPRLGEVLPWLAEAFTAAWEHTVDRDDFASLVLQAQLDVRQVQLVRAACQYLRQAGLGASPSYVRGILSAHGEFIRHWVEVFQQRFDPAGPSSADSRLAKYADAATTRDEFRVLDWYAGLLDAITRTNYFRRDSAGRSPVTTVFKLDPARLPFATNPAVKVETFVHHPDVEGLHVRYGPVARGGLRWSDRVEDYRDEVIALAKAQQVKNSLIVPAGAKGAFVVKAPLAGLAPTDAASEVRASTPRSGAGSTAAGRRRWPSRRRCSPGPGSRASPSTRSSSRNGAEGDWSPPRSPTASSTRCPSGTRSSASASPPTPT